MGVLWAQLLVFLPIFLKLCRCFLHGVQMCMWFDYFLSLFRLCEVCHFWTSMDRQWVPCERNSSYNFIPIFLKLCTCFLHGLKICMWFGYNPCINFCHFFYFVIFWPQILWKCIDSGYLVSATSHTILYRSFWNLAHAFSMVWRYARGLNIIPKLIFVTFSTSWTLSLSDLRFCEVYRQWLPCKRNSIYNFAHLFSMVWRYACGLDLILQLIFVAFPLCKLSQFSIFCRCDISFTKVWSIFNYLDDYVKSVPTYIYEIPLLCFIQYYAILIAQRKLEVMLTHSFMHVFWECPPFESNNKLCDFAHIWALFYTYSVSFLFVVYLYIFFWCSWK